MHNNKRVTSDRVQQSEQYNKRNCKHPQLTFISVNGVWNQIFNNSENITNMNFVTIQNTSLETRTGKSLWNPDNITSNNVTQSDDNVTNAGVQPKTSPFYTRHLIWANYKVASQLFKLIYLEFSYLNNVRHFSGIELCHEQKNLRLQRKSTYSFFAMDFLAFFNNAHFHIYFSWELTFFCKPLFTYGYYYF